MILSWASKPGAHTCFNRIDLPLFANQRDLVAVFDVALDPRQAQVFSMDYRADLALERERARGAPRSPKSEYVPPYAIDAWH